MTSATARRACRPLSAARFSIPATRPPRFWSTRPKRRSTGQAVGPRPRRHLHAGNGRGGQARYPHRAGSAARRLGRRGRAAFPAHRRPQDAPHDRLRDAGALDRSAISARCRRPSSSRSPRSAASSARCRSWCCARRRRQPATGRRTCSSSFNLSPSQLVDQNTGLHILSILDRAGFDPRRLEIEITETGLMTRPGLGRARSSRTCAAAAFAFRSTISAPASHRSAACASSISTS